MQPARAEADGAHRLIIRKHGKHDFTGFRDGFRRLLENRALGFEPFGLLAAQVIDDEPIARLDQISGHAATHAAGADEP